MSLFKALLRKTSNLILMTVSIVRFKFTNSDVRQLEIGSGPNKREGWVTLDMLKGADVIWDLSYKLPFKDNTFDRIYCSHVLEHFPYHEMVRLLRDMNRVLQAGGRLIITVPDASIYVDAYNDNRFAIELLQYKPAVSSTLKMDVLNYIFYMDGHHKFMFDAENLAFHCDGAGFVRSSIRSFDPSLDLAARDYESLYMECYKPA